MTSLQAVNSESVNTESGYLMIRNDRIVPFEEQPRKHFDTVSVENLAVSIENEGQNTPVQLCKSNKGKEAIFDDRGNPLFILIDGERRWRACNMIAKKTGKPFLMKATVEIVASVEEHFRRSFGANFQREDMTPLEIAAGFLRLRQGGATVEGLAKSYGKSMKYVIDYLSLNDLHKVVQNMMNPELPKERRLRVTHAVQIARVRDHQTQIALAQEAVEHNLNVIDIRMSIENSGLHLREYTAQDTGYYTPRGRRVSDDRAILTNLLQNTDHSLKKFVDRIKNGSIDMEDMYLSCKEGDEVFAHYIELLSSIGTSVLKLSEAVKKATED